MRDLAALKSGSFHCFEKIYQQYHGKLYHYVFKRTRSGYLAEEVVQQTFVRLWEKRAGLSDTVTLDEQLFRMARTILIDELRKEAVKRKHWKQVAVSVPAATAEQNLMEKEMSARLKAAIERLPPERQKVFKLSRFDGYSYKEIASELSISPKTVENQISRAIRQLRRVISLF